VKRLGAGLQRSKKGFAFGFKRLGALLIGSALSPFRRQGARPSGQACSPTKQGRAAGAV